MVVSKKMGGELDTHKNLKDPTEFSKTFKPNPDYENLF